MKRRGSMRRESRTAALALTAAMVLPAFCPLTAMAVNRDAAVSEKLYINMDYHGTVEKANVVKEIRFNEADSYTDYGHYTEIVNMTDGQTPEIDGDAVTWQRPDKNGGKLYFQGSVDPEEAGMPWTFDVTYKVNGVITAPEKVGGASGTVEINIDAIPNKNVSRYMQDNMILLVLIPMDTSDIYSIDAPDSMEAGFGNYSGIGFEALPGKEGHFTARFGTDSFESMGVMMIMTPVTVGDLAKIKDIKELKDKFRDNTDAVMDSVDAVMDNVVSMSSQLEKTNQILDELASGKRKLDETRSIIFNGVDISLQDVRDLAGLLDPVDASLKTSQWMVYELNRNINDTNAALQQTGSIMGNLSRKLRSLSREMATVNTFSIGSLEEDLTKTRAAFGELQKSLLKGGVQVNNLKMITGSEEFGEDVDELISTAALGYGEYEEEYLPQAVIEVINSQLGNTSSMNAEQMKALVPSVALMLDLYKILSEPAASGSAYTGAAVRRATPSDYYEISGGTSRAGGRYSVTAADLTAVIGAFRAAQAGDQTAIPAAVGSFIAAKNLEPADQAALAQEITALAMSGGAASAESSAEASRFVNMMISMLQLKGGIRQLEDNSEYGGAGTSLRASLDGLSEAGSEALASAIEAYSGADYEVLIREVDAVLTDIDDVLDAGSSSAYQTGRLLNSLRSLNSEVDALTATLNSYYEDVQTAVTNISNVVVETEKLSADFTQTAQMLNNTLRTASEDLSRAGDDSLDLGREAVDNTGKMIENTRKMKEAGADLRKSINDELDEQEAEHNFLNMDPYAVKESLTSSKNGEPTAIQIICRTEEISADDGANGMAGNTGGGTGGKPEDAEIPAEPTTLGQRVIRIFTTLWEKITGLFRRSVRRPGR